MISRSISTSVDGSDVARGFRRPCQFCYYTITGSRSMIPLGSYDIQHARDQMARDANENARLRAEIAAAKIKLAPLPAANLARDLAA
jgi:hypothetical protein